MRVGARIDRVDRLDGVASRIGGMAGRRSIGDDRSVECPDPGCRGQVRIEVNEDHAMDRDGDILATRFRPMTSA